MATTIRSFLLVIRLDHRRLPSNLPWGHLALRSKRDQSEVALSEAVFLSPFDPLWHFHWSWDPYPIRFYQRHHRSFASKLSPFTPSDGLDCFGHSLSSIRPYMQLVFSFSLQGRHDTFISFEISTSEFLILIWKTKWNYPHPPVYHCIVSFACFLFHICCFVCGQIDLCIFSVMGKARFYHFPL